MPSSMLKPSDAPLASYRLTTLSSPPYASASMSRVIRLPFCAVKLKKFCWPAVSMFPEWPRNRLLRDPRQ